MQFFGLVWVTSWVSYILTSSQGLFKVPDYLVSTLPGHFFSAVNSPTELPNPLVPTPLYSKIWSSKSPVATFPNLAFQMGVGSFPFRPQPAQTSVRPPVQFNGSQNIFCNPKLELENNFLPVTPLSAISTPWEQTSPREGSKATFPQQIFQVIQNLLPWRQRREPVKTLASSVVVVSTHSSEPIADKNQGEGPRVKRGFWRYSQLLSHRAFAAPDKPEPEKFQVWLKERLIAEFPSQKPAELMAERLKQFLSNPSDPYLNASPVLPAVWEGQPAVKVGDRLLFKMDDALAADLNRNPQLLVIEWANNLRVALGKVSLKLADAQKHMYNLAETPKTFKGNASWYGGYFHGRLTATGETYSQHELTAAHPSLPFDTYLKVKNLNNGASVIVRINDRGPYIPNRHLDLSREAARCIDSEKVGVIPFEAVIMQPTSVQAHEYLTRN